MHILLSNDDGIYAPGLTVLRDVLHDIGELLVVAPSSERSAVGHAITLSDPIKTRMVLSNDKSIAYAVSGTPADCVKLAVCVLAQTPPDIVISGINLGPNAGISVIYSGTVSAATEGTILGIPSMAISLNTFTNPIWESAARAARILALHLYRHPLPSNIVLNVNVPNLPWNEIKGFVAARMGESRFVETFDKRADPRGNIYYWLDGELEAIGEQKGTDLQAVKDGYIALTPIAFDLTHYPTLEALRNWDLPSS